MLRGYLVSFARCPGVGTDLAPLFSDTTAASYRLSCIRYGLLRCGGVSLNKTKLKMMPVRKAPKAMVSRAYMGACEKKRSDWVTCKFCGRGLPSMFSLRQHLVVRHNCPSLLESILYLRTLR
eukprot:COSAG06_NODE_310_length_17775_cov_9.971374_2_plen_122_part_00